MKRIGRVVLLVLGGIIAVTAVLLLAINMHVQSQHTHARIEHELSERLGTTLRIRRISVTPWKGLALTGIAIPQTTAAGSGATDFLSAESFELRVRYLSLFSQRLVIKEVSLIEPKVTWYQNADGEWRLPAPIVRAAPAQPTPTPEAAISIAPGGDANAPRSTTSAAPESRPTAFTPEVRRVNLVGGSFRFFDARGRPIANFEDVQFHSNFRNTADVRGNVAIAKTSLRDRFFLQHLQARLAYGPGALELTDITADAAGGRMSGRFDMQPKSAESPFVANVKFEGLDANRVVTEAGGSSGTIAGKLEGFLDASGKTADPNALAGSGEVVLRDGQLRQYSLLNALGQMLQIPELQQLHLDDAHANYHISPGMVTVDELRFRSPNVRLSATGTIFFDGRLQLQSQLAIDDQIRNQLFRPVRDNFQPIDEPGFAALGFEIGGTIERPKSDLLEKLVGRDLKDIGSAINSLIGGHEKKHKKNEARPDVQSASAPPSPSPSATP
ncbi:MAG: AsmA-like C-terminal region-containing protein [Chthoniobacterales bacterium]